MSTLKITSFIIKKTFQYQHLAFESKLRHTRHKHTILEYHMGSKLCSESSWHCLRPLVINPKWAQVNYTIFCFFEYVSTPSFQTHSRFLLKKKYNILSRWVNFTLHPFSVWQKHSFSFSCRNVLWKHTISRCHPMHIILWNMHIILKHAIFTQSVVQKWEQQPPAHLFQY